MAVVSAIRQLGHWPARDSGHDVPLVAVPFMGRAGRKECEKARVSWLDLSGNAHVSAPGLTIRIEGRPNQFKQSGRPQNVFAPKSSRVSRWFLTHPGRQFSQSEIIKATGVDPAQVSRVLRELHRLGLVHREARLYSVKDPDLWLEAWRERYEFAKHDVRMGHVTSRNGSATTQQLAEVFRSTGRKYAATGLSAAWMYTHFATFRIATVYVSEFPEAQNLKKIGFEAGERGANTWIVIPKDEGVFQGSVAQEGVECVSPVQTYLDLDAHPERSEEAAAQLRAEWMVWGVIDAR